LIGGENIKKISPVGLRAIILPALPWIVGKVWGILKRELVRYGSRDPYLGERLL